jgi:uncharacterized membrane protein YdjX (TVP38/TMEM64 family)
VAGSFWLGPKITEISRDPDALKEILGSGSFKSHLWFLGIQFLQTVFALIPGEFVEVAAGYIFGSISGLILCLIGVALATALIFTLTRLLGRKFTEIMIDSRDLKRLKFLQDEKKLEIMFALLFFIPGTPKDLITYFAGVTKIKFGTFMIISVFCRIPSIVTSTLAGAALGKENYLLSAIIFAATGLVAIFGILLYRKLSKKTEEK